MEVLTFSIKINAPKEKVWQVLWNDDTYRKWTSVFNESSYAVSDWNEGSKIQFLTAGGSGMFSVIEKKIDFIEMTFKHLGEIINGVEENKNWEGAIERYTLAETNGNTELIAELHTLEEYRKYFDDTFPKALETVKQLAEG
jgi:hypothetical protein